MPLGPEQLIILAIGALICLGPGILGAFLVWTVLRNRNMAPGDYPPRDQNETDITAAPSNAPDSFGWSSDATLADLNERLTRIEQRLDDLERDRDRFR